MTVCEHRDMVASSEQPRGDAVYAALANDRAQELRQQVAAAVPRCLAENGSRLATHHQLSGNAGGLGFAIATEMAAELGEGAARLFAASLWYPGAALVRQLIECIYLMTLMGEERHEAASWIRSSRQQIQSTFMPGQMRQRSVRNFRLAEYQSHCDCGGHPNPAGRPLLRNHDEWRAVSPLAFWLDLAQHLAESWDSFCAALPLYDPRLDEAHDLYTPHRAPAEAGVVTALLARWREEDPLARGLPPEAFVPRPTTSS